MQAEIEIIINCGLVFSNTATTIGIKIPKVPQEVPVAKAKRQPTTKIIAGRKFNRLPALASNWFGYFYIAGEYVYCDGETLRWRDLTFKKTNDKRYEKLPRVGRPLK